MGVANEASDDEEYIVSNITLVPFAYPIPVFVCSFIARVQVLLFSIESFLTSKFVSVCQLLWNNP
jgi:hypothetical protein